MGEDKSLLVVVMTAFGREMSYSHGVGNSRFGECYGCANTNKRRKRVSY